ncbi:MAG: hypothetical protein AB8G05_21310 [Oligoflexales bacterium]
MTVNFAPPEAHQNPSAKVAGTKVDIFSSGIMLLQAKYGATKNLTHEAIWKCCDKKANKLFNKASYRQAYEGEYYKLIKKKAEDLPPGVEKEEVRLIADMINPNPNARPTIQEVKTRWKGIHPRNQKGMFIANKVFDR